MKRLYRKLFEDYKKREKVMIKAYNLNTILAEKIESILVRNVSNTRGRDFYDICILATLNKANLDRLELKKAIGRKLRKERVQFILKIMRNI